MTATDLHEALTAAMQCELDRLAGGTPPSAPELVRAALAVLKPALAAERERCAQKAEEWLPYAADRRAARGIAAAIRALSPSAPADPWQSIETAPKKGAPWILVSAPAWLPVPAAWYRNAWRSPWWASSDEQVHELKFKPTHWMPLPTPHRRTTAGACDDRAKALRQQRAVAREGHTGL